MMQHFLRPLISSSLFISKRRSSNTVRGSGVEQNNLGSLVRLLKHWMESLVLDRQIRPCFHSLLQLEKLKSHLHTVWIVYMEVESLPLGKWCSHKWIQLHWYLISEWEYPEILTFHFICCNTLWIYAFH